MKLMSLDLEMNQPSGNIIQIGAVVGNTVTLELEEEFNVYTKLPEGEDVAEYIYKLCGISQNMVKNGTEVPTAYNLLKDFYKANRCNSTVVTWGGGDSWQLYKQSGDVEPNFMGSRWMDVKTVFQTLQIARQRKARSGLSKSMQKMGLRFIGKPHNALDDAKNTLRFYFHMLQLLKRV